MQELVQHLGQHLEQDLEQDLEHSNLPVDEEPTVAVVEEDLIEDVSIDGMCGVY